MSEARLYKDHRNNPRENQGNVYQGCRDGSLVEIAEDFCLYPTADKTVLGRVCVSTIYGWVVAIMTTLAGGNQCEVLTSDGAGAYYWSDLGRTDPGIADNEVVRWQTTLGCPKFKSSIVLLDDNGNYTIINSINVGGTATALTTAQVSNNALITASNFDTGTVFTAAAATSTIINSTYFGPLSTATLSGLRTHICGSKVVGNLTVNALSEQNILQASNIDTGGSIIFSSLNAEVSNSHTTGTITFQNAAQSNAVRDTGLVNGGNTITFDAASHCLVESSQLEATADIFYTGAMFSSLRNSHLVSNTDLTITGSEIAISECDLTAIVTIAGTNVRLNSSIIDGNSLTVDAASKYVILDNFNTSATSTFAVTGASQLNIHNVTIVANTNLTLASNTQISLSNLHSHANNTLTGGNRILINNVDLDGTLTFGNSGLHDLVIQNCFIPNLKSVTLGSTNPVVFCCLKNTIFNNVFAITGSATDSEQINVMNNTLNDAFTANNVTRLWVTNSLVDDPVSITGQNLTLHQCLIEGPISTGNTSLNNIELHNSYVTSVGSIVLGSIAGGASFFELSNSEIRAALTVANCTRSACLSSFVNTGTSLSFSGGSNNVFLGSYITDTGSVTFNNVRSSIISSEIAGAGSVTIGDMSCILASIVTGTITQINNKNLIAASTCNGTVSLSNNFFVLGSYLVSGSSIAAATGTNRGTGLINVKAEGGSVSFNSSGASTVISTALENNQGGGYGAISIVTGTNDQNNTFIGCLLQGDTSTWTDIRNCTAIGCGPYTYASHISRVNIDSGMNGCTFIGNSGRNASGNEWSVLIASDGAKTGNSPAGNTRHQICGGAATTGNNSSTARRKWQIDSVNGTMYAVAFTPTAAFPDYAEYFENETVGEISPGTLVTLRGDRIRIATSPSERILGAVSRTAAVAAGCAGFAWKDMYLKTKFGETILNENREPIQNPDWDESLAETYQSREERRSEWSLIGILGQILVRADSSFDSALAITLAASGPVYLTTNSLGFLALSALNAPTNLEFMKVQHPYDATDGYGVIKCLIR